MKNYMKFLNNGGQIEANYVWNKDSEYLEGFLYGDYIVNEVPAVSGFGENYVATLVKK